MINLKKVFILTFTVVALISCADKNKSLEYYFVDSENKENFMLLDLSPNLLALTPGDMSEVKDVFKTVKKINLLALKKTETNEEKFTLEYNKVKVILNQSKYQELTRVKDKKISMQVRYVGDDENIQEVVVFAKDKTTGFLIGRILGDNLKVEDIMKMVDQLPKLQNIGTDLSKLQQFIK